MAKNGGNVLKGIVSQVQMKTHLENKKDFHDKAKPKVLIKMAVVILQIKSAGFCHCNIDGRLPHNTMTCLSSTT